MTGIYTIQSISKPDRVYVGSAVDVFERFDGHLRRLRNNKHHSQKMQNHFNKYGSEDLTFSILESCAASELIKREQYYIDTLHPWFNMCPKAGNTLGLKGVWSDETRERFSAYRKANSIGEKNGFYGKKHDEETRAKMREAWKHRITSPRPEHSELMKGVNNPNAKLSESDIEEMLFLVNTKAGNYKQIAQRFGVCADTVYRINKQYGKVKYNGAA